MSSRHTIALLIISAALFLPSCATTGAGSGEPMALKSVQETAPAEIRAIEKVVDQGGVIKAEEVIIHVSRNYEWDVSLSGNHVERQRHVGNDEHVSYAVGNPRAMFRNLDIRAWRKIYVHKSGFDVVPFIRITAKGRAVFIENVEGGKPKIHEADAILIRNTDVRFVQKGDMEALGDISVPDTAGAASRLR